jgi:hypothetical protein
VLIFFGTRSTSKLNNLVKNKRRNKQLFHEIDFASQHLKDFSKEIIEIPNK